MKDFKSKTCCFTGHRNIPSEKVSSIYKQLENVVENLICNGYLYFGSGGARGFDTIASEVVLNLKKRYPQIRLILVLPCIDQAKGWNKKDLAKYKHIKNKADKVVYTSYEYSKDCMYRRNRHLVDNSSACICYLNKNFGGTFYTVNYAKKHDIFIINVDSLL